MRWCQEFESGLLAIDVQHRQLFSLILRLQEMDDSTARAQVRDVVVELVQLARCHFDCEEWLMSAYDYPEFLAHAADHSKLLHEIQGYRNNLVFRPEKLALVLSNWLISHTIQDDRPLVRHLQSMSPGRLEVPREISTFEAFDRTAQALGLDVIDLRSDDTV